MIKFHQMHVGCTGDVDALFELYRATPEYFRKVKGRAATVDDAREALETTPPGDGNYVKIFGGYWLDDRLIGSSDIV